MIEHVLTKSPPINGATMSCTGNNFLKSSIYENFEKKLVYKILITIIIILVADLICSYAIICC